MKILNTQSKTKTEPPNLYQWIEAGNNTTVVCEFTLAELRTLRLMCGYVVGPPDTTIRRWTSQIWDVLADHPDIMRGCPQSVPDALVRNIETKNINQ